MSTEGLRQVRAMGDRGLLVEAGPNAVALAEAVRRQHIAGVIEAIPAATTVLVRHDSTVDRNALTRLLTTLEPVETDQVQHSIVVIEVHYDGADLSDVAELTALSIDEVIARHSAPTYEVAFCGFAPGFAYLRGLDPALAVPRLSTPRTRVPARSVAIADSWSAVYPRESPGGWSLIGRTEVALFDVLRAEPALLTPGTRVQFRQVSR